VSAPAQAVTPDPTTRVPNVRLPPLETEPRLAALVKVESRAMRATGRQLGEEVDQAQVAALGV